MRRRGYTVERSTPASRRLRDLLAELDSLTVRQRPTLTGLLHEIGAIEYLDDDLEAGRTYPVSVMTAPAFAGDRVAVLSISVHVWDDLEPARIQALGDRLLAASRAITRDIHGTAPDDFPQGSPWGIG